MWLKIILSITGLLCDLIGAVLLAAYIIAAGRDKADHFMEAISTFVDKRFRALVRKYFFGVRFPKLKPRSLSSSFTNIVRSFIFLICAVGVFILIIVVIRLAPYRSPWNLLIPLLVFAMFGLVLFLLILSLLEALIAFHIFVSWISKEEREHRVAILGLAFLILGFVFQAILNIANILPNVDLIIAP